ncbi:transglycosylase SLT domain-containing protein [uncultured Nocardioides sp.]|uniref:transglycosylase SLT domain-containing protein n=2 Tax=uncultured Nocardioides sp. TaxID=198441 RepID=UPI002623CD0D|nr:transglycosylase SLT domain-containing protein [uncultured Nocardioides sp.]
MSIAAVEARIAQIQGQLTQLQPAAPMNGAVFAQMMSGATAAYGSTAAGAATGGTATAEGVIATARQYVGMPYVWGGSSPADGGMDCSGLVQHVFGQHGIDLPRVSNDQARSGAPVASLAEARPGDLVAWDRSSRNDGADHIAIYLGDGMILEAPRTGLDIRVISLEASGHGTPDFIRRVLPGDAAVGVAPAARVAPTGTSQVTGVPFAELFNAAGSRYGVDPVLLAAMARTESSFQPGAVSPAGAQGLMQLMPGTARGLGVADPFDPAQAVDGAARLMRDLIDRFGRVDHALAGYNAGPGAVLRYDGVPPYAETQGYVAKILALVEGA